MGGVRGKSKRQPIVSAGDDKGTIEDEKLLVTRRGRPQKPFKDDLEEEGYEAAKENNELEEMVSKGGGKNQASVENGRKRKRPSPVKENADSVEEENGVVETRTNPADLIKNVGYRHKGSKRKSKPRRAAEVGVECR